MFEKRYVWIVVIWFREHDDEGEEINFSGPSDELITFTYADAVKLKKQLLADDHDYYRREWIESVEILDEPQEMEILV